jgi:hypothetical protein
MADPPEQTRTRNIAVMLTKMEKDSSSGLLAPKVGKWRAESGDGDKRPLREAPPALRADLDVKGA